MKRLLIALAAAAAMSASAKINDTQLFESTFADFVADIQGEDDSELAGHASAPAIEAPYPCEGFGQKYLALDTGSATLWRNVSAAQNVFFDMAVQFNPSSSAPALSGESNAKVAVYLNTSSNIVVVAGASANDQTPTSYVTTATVAPGSWHRLTIAAVNEDDSLVFQVYVGGTLLQTEGGDDLFYSMSEGTTVTQVGFTGSGALDDFVARTTDPFIDAPAATIAGEGYASFEDALADNPTAIVQLEDDATMPAPLAYTESISVKLNNHTLSGITTGSLVPVASTSGDVTTYTAAYFPRTATAGQDGTAANPYELADADDLQALKDAFAADATLRAKNYKLVANIDATSLGYWDGIGDYLTANSGLNGGTLDGAGYAISNLSFSNGKYRAFFNRVDNSTIKDLTINVVDIAQPASASAEHGYSAFSGKVVGSTIKGCTATGTIGTTAKPAMHTCGGFAVATDGNTAFVDCTNYISVVCSLNDNPKIGGIVGLVQGSAASAVSNCWNFGDMTITANGVKNVNNGAGGLVGYSQIGLTIYGGGNAGTIAWTKTTEGDSANNAVMIGTVVGKENGGTATVSGGVVAQADAAPAGSFANVSGLTYATVENNVATFVPDVDLAAGNTYVLQQSVAAGTVYTFDAPGSIAFNTNGFNFAGTVAVDRSALTPATSETAGTVVTFTAAAGVASVDDEAYATFAEAVAALDGAEDGYVTLLDDIADTFTVTEVGSLAVRRNAHSLTVVGADGLVMGTPVEDPSTGITTYTAVEGVAAYTATGANYIWFATFEEAFNAAYKFADNQCDMKVKVGADWALPSTIAHSLPFYSLTFIATTADPIEISLTNANYRISSTRYTFPANATLHVVSGSIDSISGGTVDIPEGVTLTLPAGSSGTLNNVSGLTGAGTLVAPTDSGALKNFIASAKYSGWLKAGTWTGTLQCSGNTTDATFSNIANANASIRFSGFTNFVHNTTSASSFKAIELVGDGLTLAGDYSTQNIVWTFANALKGDGTLNVAVTGNGTASYLKTIKFTGDVSGFAGDIKFTDGTTYAADDVLIFGTDASSVAKAIVVSDGIVMTNATGKTWNAPGGVVVNGTLVANGTVTTAAALDGSGIYEVNATTAAIKVADTWTGTYIANFKAANNAIFYIPVNASATTVINGVNGEFGGYPRLGDGAPNVAGPVTLNANWTIANGWYGTGYTTTFAKLSGSGNLTVDGTTSGHEPIYYTITELDGYTGTLGGARGNFTIGKVNVATQPADGALVVKINIGVDGAMLSDNVPLYVGGVDSGATLAYDASGASGEGLYYFAPKTYVAQLGDDGDMFETLAGAVDAAGDGDTVKLLADITLDARVDVNAVAGDEIVIDLCGHTITREGTSGNGSVIDVKSGHIVITNGVIDCTQDDTAIVADGVYALTVRSGATLTLDALTVTVDSQAGACVYPFAGATVTILGGTYGNETAVAYQYHENWTGMAVNQANVSQQLITISGGRFYKVNPDLGDDSWADGQGTFLASGYESKQEGDYWVVSEKSGESLEPGESSESYATEQEAEAAAAAVEIAVPTAVAAALDSAAEETYKGLFEAKAVSDGAGGYKVEVVMKDKAVEDVELQAAADAAEVVKAITDDDVTLATTPGLYYSFEYGTSLENMTEGDRTLATGTSLELARPTTPNATSGFYKVLVNITDK